MKLKLFKYGLQVKGIDSSNTFWLSDSLILIKKKTIT